jgi:hypothetical protein
MAEPNGSGTPSAGFEFERLENFLKIYANSANIEVSLWDFKLVFGELKTVGNKQVIEQSVAVTMSPQHAKVLAGVLNENVKKYEEAIGEIKLPTSTPKK